MRRLHSRLLLSLAVAGLSAFTASSASAQVTPACLDDVQPGDVHVQLRASKDARIMKTHAKPNDGGAGLMRIKRSSHVRGMVGFDLSCLDAQDPAALAQVRCATLDVSVFKGKASKRRQVIFHAHRMTVPWPEGDEAFNRFKVKKGRLGQHPGTVPGVTWACRSDYDTGWPRDVDCAPEDVWIGADSGPACGAGPCYDTYGGSPPAAQFEHKKQPIVAWDVSDDVRAHDPATAVDDLSWLLKVADEEVKSGSVRVYSREGAEHKATYDPKSHAGAHFDLAPVLHLYAPSLPTLGITALGPTAPVSTDTACVSFTEGSDVVRARWENLTTGEWGWMDETGGCGAGWSGTVPLSTAAGDQPNELEITVLDACAQEAVFTHSVTHQP